MMIIFDKININCLTYMKSFAKKNIGLNFFLVPIYCGTWQLCKNVMSKKKTMHWVFNMAFAPMGKAMFLMPPIQLIRI